MPLGPDTVVADQAPIVRSYELVQQPPGQRLRGGWNIVWAGLPVKYRTAAVVRVGPVISGVDQRFGEDEHRATCARPADATNCRNIVRPCTHIQQLCFDTSSLAVRGSGLPGQEYDSIDARRFSSNGEPPIFGDHLTHSVRTTQRSFGATLPAVELSQACTVGFGTFWDIFGHFWTFGRYLLVFATIVEVSLVTAGQKRRGA